MERKVIIEPFFNAILSAIMSVFNAIIEGILSPVIAALQAVVQIIVDFVAENVLKPMFAPLGYFLAGIVYVFKPIFAFVGKILDFIVTLIYFIFTIFDMIVTLPLKILEVLGIIKPADQNSALKGLSQLTSVVSDLNNGFRESSSNVNVVINKNNFSLLSSGLVIAIILLMGSIYFDKFSFITRGMFGTV
jgi:hypothetical protein